MKFIVASILVFFQRYELGIVTMNKRMRRNSPSKVKKGYFLFVDLSAEEEIC